MSERIQDIRDRLAAAAPWTADHHDLAFLIGEVERWQALAAPFLIEELAKVQLGGPRDPRIDAWQDGEE